MVSILHLLHYIIYGYSSICTIYSLELLISRLTKPYMFLKNDHIFTKFGIFVENSILFKKNTQKILSYFLNFISTDSKTSAWV